MIWNRLLGAFFVLILIDGALRKWVAPGQATLIYFLKDIVLLVAFCLFWLRYDTRLPKRSQNSSVAAALGAYVMVVLLEALNPRAPNFAVSLLGVKSHLLYLLLLILVPAALQISTDPTRWARRYVVWAAVPISVLAIYQYLLPPSHWLNHYLSEAAIEEIATAGLSGAVRVTGTFSYITGMSTFVIFNFGLGAGLMIAGLKGERQNLWVGVSLLALTLVVAPMTGSRAALYLPAFAVPIVLLSLIGRGILNGRIVIAAMFVISVWIVLPDLEFGAGWTTFGERIESAGDGEERVNDAIFGPFRKLDVAGFLGFGTGSTHQSAPRLVPSEVPYSWLPDIYFEEENGRVGLELGILGFISYIYMKLCLCIVAILILHRAENDIDILIGISSTVFFIAHMVVGIVFNPVAGAIYWGLAGCIIFSELEFEARKCGQ